MRKIEFKKNSKKNLRLVKEISGARYHYFVERRKKILFFWTNWKKFDNSKTIDLFEADKFFNNKNRFMH